MLDCSMNNKWNTLNISKLLCFATQDMLIHISLMLVTSWFGMKNQFSISKLSINIAQCSRVLQVNCYSPVTVLLSICNNILNFRKNPTHVRTNSVNVRKFGHVHAGYFMSITGGQMLFAKTVNIISALRWVQ